jgi:peroxiredoxin
MNTLLNSSLLQRTITAGLISLTLLVSGCQSSNVSETTQNGQNAVTEEVSKTTDTVAQNSGTIRVGAPAPEFTGVDSNGKTHNLSDFKGRVVVLEWTNHECPFVKKHYDSNNMQKLQQEANAKDVVWLSVISSASGQQGNVTPQQANELTSSRKASPTAVLLDADGKIGRLYNARTTPHMFVIDKDGTLQYDGAIDDKASTNTEDVATANNYVRAAMDSVLKGEPVTTATTQPYGCSVKYGT